MNDALAQAAVSHMVPGEFAEKAMASLMQMHSELMDEKERRVELFRKLMEREQTVAELRMYVKLLEERLAPAQAPERPLERPEPVPLAPRAMPEAPVSAHVRAPAVAPPLPPRMARPKVDGWKTW
jgi:hypothetical protein